MFSMHRSLIGVTAILLLSACSSGDDVTTNTTINMPELPQGNGAGEAYGDLYKDDADNKQAVDSNVLPSIPKYTDWPRVESVIKADAAQEAWIADVVKGMTLAQKVGQMTQPEAKGLTDEDVRKYYIGSILSGGNDWPVRPAKEEDADKWIGKKNTPSEWLKVIDGYWEASMSTDMEVKVPVLYGVDAVHGNQKQYHATLFPHNIGIGAAHDTSLAMRIGEATAQQMRVSGFEYTFAPCVTVPQDDRWGRSYEGFSEYPFLVRELSAAMTDGLMDINSRGNGFSGVITTAKHFLGDGSTNGGEDQGVSTVTEETLINLHAQGYFTSLAAGAQTVMPSYNSWESPEGRSSGKIHGSKYLLTTVLKEKMGFDGFVISDYNGIGMVDGCTNTKCAQAINAGIDVVMVPYKADWVKFIEDTMALVDAGEIPMERIDDAVTRILRVKLRAGLFELPKPSERTFAGNEDKLNHSNLAREAVRKSLVLLKNNDEVLPLSRTSRVLVVGKSGDSIPNQVGGWSLGWQNYPPFDENTNADFVGQTILSAVKNVVGDDKVTFSENADNVNVNEYDVVIAAIGEIPYAEFVGDINWNKRYNWGPTEGVIPEGYAAKQTLENAARNPEDLAVLDKVSGKGVPVVSVYLSGRPLYTNKELNRSNAFVAAWLPGTEAAGITDVLFRNDDDEVNYDFKGKLSFSWPQGACQTLLNVGQPGYDPLFKYGFGLTYKDTYRLGQLQEKSGPANGCEN